RARTGFSYRRLCRSLLHAPCGTRARPTGLIVAPWGSSEGAKPVGMGREVSSDDLRSAQVGTKFGTKSERLGPKLDRPASRQSRTPGAAVADATGGLDGRQSAPPARYRLPRAPTRRGADHAKSTRLRCAACRLPLAGEE